MKGRDISVLLIPFAAALAVYFPQTTGGTIPAPAAVMQTVQSGQSPDKEERQRLQPDVDRPLALRNAAGVICEFLGLDKANCQQSIQGTNYPPGQAPADRYKLEFLIATLPDPKDSNLNYTFDRNLDAIQRAIGAADYVLDRYTLPWLDRVDEKGRPEGVACQPHPEREPGVILFRGHNTRLVLFLVGETPTVGIHKTAMKDALNQVAQLSGWNTRPCQQPTCLPNPHLSAQDREIRVLGPSFSGSTESLARALHDWLRAFPISSKPRFKIISGSAMAFDKGNEEFQKLATQASFYATVMPNGSILEAFTKYLEDLEPDSERRKIALLTEAGTGYGRAVRSAVKRLKKDRLQEGLPPDGRSQPDEEKETSGRPSLRSAEERSPLTLRFPFHISHLRSAAEKAKPMRTGAATEPSAPRRQTLPLTMDDGSETKVVVPLFSQLETVSAELVLANLLSVIDRERVRYVGIMATDVRDRIFLAREIRKHCPNVVLFTFNSDLFYLHSEANLDLQGMLVITPYPLFNPNQSWTYPFTGNRARLQFPTQAAQGIYNAALALLGRPDQMVEYGSPFDIPHVGMARRPALWVSAVGRNSLWPVTLLKYEDPQGYLYSPYQNFSCAPYAQVGGVATVDQSAEKPLFNVARALPAEASIIAILLLSWLCAIIVGAMLARHNFFPHRNEPTNPRRLELFLRRLAVGLRPRVDGLSLSQLFGDAVFPAGRFERGLYLFAFCVNLLVIYLIVACVFFLPDFAAFAPALAKVRFVHASLGHLLVKIVVVIIFALIVMGVVSQAGAIVRSFKNRRLRQHSPLAIRAMLVFVFAGPLVALGLLFRLGWYLWTKLPAEGLIFLYLRSIHSTSGLSPLLPIVFVGLAGLLWSFCSLRRLRYLEQSQCLPVNKMRQPLFYLNFDTKSFAGVTVLERRVTDLLTRSAFDLPAWYLILLPLGFACYRLFCVRSVHYIEGPFFTWFFGSIFFLVYLALALTFLRFVYVWRVMRQLLQRLSWHPLRAIYEGLPKNFPGMPRMNLAVPPPGYTTLAFSVDRASQLWQLAEQVSEQTAGATRLSGWGTQQRWKFYQALGQAEYKLAAALKAEAQGNWRRALWMKCQTKGALAEIAQVVAEILEPYWRVPGTILPPVKHLDPEEQEWVEQGQRFLASRAVAFLHHIFVQLQNLLVCVMTGLLLMLLAVTSYPFQPRELLLLFNWSIILSVVVMTLVIFVQMGRDKILGLLAGGTPGQLTWSREFIFRVLIYGLLPILALLGAQFPEVIRQIVSWIGAIHGGAISQY